MITRSRPGASPSRASRAPCHRERWTPKAVALGVTPTQSQALLPASRQPSLVEVHRTGLADGLNDLGHRVGQALAGLPLEFGDHAGRDRDAQRVGEEALDLAFA